MQNLSDEELMLSYQKGEISAMDEIVQRYKNPIYHFAYRLSSNTAEAQDITQEVFLRIHQHRLGYAPTAKFSTWIFTIAHHLCVSRLRRKKWLVLWPRKENELDELMDFQSPNPSPQETAVKNDFQAIVKRCVHTLPFLQREALLLCEYENLDYAEIGKILKKPIGTIKTLIYRARQNLKQKLLPYIREGV